MIFYRVSRQEYNPGDPIWEIGDGPGHAAGSHNVAQFITLVQERDEQAIQQILSSYQDRQINTAYLEAVMENIRASEFKDKPIRFDNMMLFTNESNARDFYALYRLGQGHIYEVELPDNAAYFSGDMQMIDTAPSLLLNDIEVMARRYWRGEKTANMVEEIILNPNSKAIVKVRIL